jgi:hypothetical protein
MKKIPFHPVVFAIYPVIALLAANVSEIPFGDTRRGFCAALLLGVLSLCILQLLVKNWHKAALITSIGMILFFTYGHIYSLIQGVSVGPLLIGRTLVLVPLWVLMWGVWVWFVLRRIKKPQEFTRIFNLIALVLILLPLYTISSFAIQTQQVRRSYQSEVSPVSIDQLEENPPDVFYVILDMHARADVLEAIYDYDLTWFIDALEERGFYVAGQSTSNYGSTLYSLSSSLNMKYINYLGEIYAADADTKEPLLLLLKENKLFQVFKGFGYQTVAFETGLYNTELKDADIYVKPTPEQIESAQVDWALNSFEENLVYTTLARVLFDLHVLENEEFTIKTIETPYRLQRLNILNIISRIPDFSQGEDPHFVFAHIISPHPPYVFGPNGEEIQHDVPFSLAGPGRIKGGEKEIQQYVDQLTYLDTLILQMIDKIIQRSDIQPIIIIQADHGPNAYTSVDQLEKGNMKEQYAIFNAYYFPDGNYSLLYPSITPVNSFRAVLNTYFGGTYEFLPDKSYISPHYRRFEFIDVTDRTKTDALIP